jgi:hypothetical protein
MQQLTGRAARANPRGKGAAYGGGYLSGSESRAGCFARLSLLAAPEASRSTARLTTRRIKRSIAVGVAQLVELLVVVQAVAGSNPVAHPIQSPRKRGGFVFGSPIRGDRQGPNWGPIVLRASRGCGSAAVRARSRLGHRQRDDAIDVDAALRAIKSPAAARVAGDGPGYMFVQLGSFGCVSLPLTTAS